MSPGRPKKIDQKKLFYLLRSGRSKSYCAKYFSVSPAAVTQASRNLSVGVSKSLVMERGSQIVEESIDTLAQIRKINTHTNSLIDLVVAWIDGDPKAEKILKRHHRLGGIGGKKNVNALSFRDPKELLLRACQEIRSQISLALQIYESLYNFRAVESFQSEVLQAIGEEAPDVREKIIRRLKEKNTLRRSLQLTK